MKSHLFLVSLSGILLAACDVEDSRKADHELIQGTWTLVSNEDGGGQDPTGHNVVITADKITLTSGDGKVSEIVYQLEPHRTPKWIDLTVRGETWLGIYELNADTLKICANDEDGGTRSTRFESRPSSNNDILLVFNRGKP